MNTIHDDLIQRSVDIHRPTGLDSENADLFAHNTIVIADVVDDWSGRLGKPWPRSLEHQPQVRLRES
jgi:hypothetical protein